MYPVKRQGEFSEFYTVERKKLRPIVCKKSLSINCIEDFSNEVFYEIFEYLDGCDIYRAFLNLNYRFQHLITYSLLPLRIKLKSIPISEVGYWCKTIILPNTERLLSLCLINEVLINTFLTHCILDSLFYRLESIVFKDISPEKFVVLLFYLKSLPRLFSLTTHLHEQRGYDITDFYRLIFSLSFLKSNNLSLDFEHYPILVPLASNEQFSTIEYLAINHRCTFHDLASLLSHTPRLRHLTCEELIESEFDIQNQNPLVLTNLTYIYFDQCQVEFDDLEIFMKKLRSQVKLLYIHQNFGVGYFDAHRWERLILNYLPHLHRFDYEYHEYCNEDYEDVHFNEIINRFLSPFWVERQWIFELEIDDNEIHCSIHPYKKKWYDKSIQHDINPNQTNVDNSSTEFKSTIELSITNCYNNEQNQLFTDTYKSIFVATPFTSLNITCQEIPVRTLIEILRLLPNLDSLTILSLPVFQLCSLPIKDLAIYLQISVSNKITKVNLVKITDFDQMHFLINLCPYMHYLQVGELDNMDLEMHVRFILMKANTYISHLCALCLCFSNANEQMVDNLRKMIDTDRILQNYMIRRECNNIFLKWK